MNPNPYIDNPKFKSVPGKPLHSTSLKSPFLKHTFKAYLIKEVFKKHIFTVY